MLTQERKTELIDIISNALSELIPAESEYNSLPEKQPDEDIPVEMLSIKECAAEFKGLSEHSIRLLVARNKIPSFRAGEGVNGKIMINKYALKQYLETL